MLRVLVGIGWGMRDYALLLTSAFQTAFRQLYISRDHQYTLSGNLATITSYTGVGGAAEIPWEFNGYLVVDIGSYAFQNCYNLNPSQIRQLDSLQQPFFILEVWSHLSRLGVNNK